MVSKIECKTQGCFQITQRVFIDCNLFGMWGCLYIHLSGVLAGMSLHTPQWCKRTDNQGQVIKCVIQRIRIAVVSLIFQPILTLMLLSTLVLTQCYFECIELKIDIKKMQNYAKDYAKPVCPNLSNISRTQKSSAAQRLSIEHSLKYFLSCDQISKRKREDIFINFSVGKLHCVFLAELCRK